MVVQTYASLLPPALPSSSVPHPFMLSPPALSSLEVTVVLQSLLCISIYSLLYSYTLEL